MNSGEKVFAGLSPGGRMRIRTQTEILWTIPEERFSLKTDTFYGKEEHPWRAVSGLLNFKASQFYVRTLRSSSKGPSIPGSPRKATDDQETSSDRILPSHLMRRWKRVGRILNVANTLAKLKVKDR